MPVSTSQTPDFKRIYIRALHLPGVHKIYFSSIITEYSDTWTPKWTPANVYGRMDPISFYSTTSREMTLGFRVISDDKAEASMNMTKLQKLIQWQYPSYVTGRHSGQSILKAPPYLGIRFMNILGGGGELQGYINGALQINPGFQSKDNIQYFEHDNDSPGKIYFSDVNIVLRMQILHQRKVGFTNRFKPNSKYPYGVEDSDVQEAVASSQNSQPQAGDDSVTAGLITAADNAFSKDKELSLSKRGIDPNNWVGLKASEED